MTINKPKDKGNNRVNSWKKLWATLALAWALLSTNPQEAKSQSINDTVANNTNKPELFVSDTTNTDTVKKNTISFTKWFNALQTSLTNEWNARIRNYANFWLDIKLWENEALQLWYSWLNQFTQNLEWYFGKHVPNIWLKWIPNLKAIGIIKTDNDGVIDSKYGLRYLVSDQAGVDYWRIDVAGNKTWASATFFLWKNIGNKWTNIEVLTDVQFDAENKKVLAPYTELQLNQEISKGFNVFMRWEIPWVKYKDGTYLLWVSNSF